jgi:hypothetical protein
VPFYGISVDVISMMHEVNLVANPMIGESALPDLLITANDRSEVMRTCALDQLEHPLDGYVVRGSQQQMDVFWHDDKRVQFVTAFTSIAVERLQEEAYVSFDDEQFTPMESRERHEIRSRRRDESSRLQEQTSAAKAAIFV